MKELDNFTVERLEDLINDYEHDGHNDASQEEVIELVRIALAAKRAEPVAYMRESDEGREYNAHNEFSCGGRGIPLYDVPQLNSQQQWIKCSDRMPDRGVDVLACRYNEIVDIEVAQWHGGMNRENQSYMITSADGIEPTHWMPLPTAPEGSL